MKKKKVQSLISSTRAPGSYEQYIWCWWHHPLLSFSLSLSLYACVCVCLSQIGARNIVVKSSATSTSWLPRESCACARPPADKAAGSFELLGCCPELDAPLVLVVGVTEAVVLAGELVSLLEGYGENDRCLWCSPSPPAPALSEQPVELTVIAQRALLFCHRCYGASWLAAAQALLPGCTVDRVPSHQEFREPHLLRLSQDHPPHSLKAALPADASAANGTYAASRLVALLASTEVRPSPRQRYGAARARCTPPRTAHSSAVGAA